MTLFTPVQFRVLKTSWIPVLIIWLIQAGYALGVLYKVFEYNSDNRVFLASVIPLLVVVVWEMLVKKAWKNAAIIAGTVIVVVALQSVLTDMLTRRTDGDVAYLIGKIDVFAGVLVIFITRCYVNGMGDKPGAAVIGALIYFLLPQDGLPLNNLQLARDLPIYALFTPVMRVLLALPAIYCFFICYYVIVYLLENSYKWKNFRLVLQSRLQVMTKWEYFFLFISLCFAYTGAIGVLDTNIYRFFEEGPQPVPVAGYLLFSTLGMILLLYTAAGLIRNVVTSRALTVGKYSFWTLLLHFIPVINIAAIVYLFCATDKPATVSEHAATYVQQERKPAQQIMIAAGILVTVFNIYMLLTQPTGLRLPMIGLLGALYLLKIFVYTRLRTGMAAVVLVMVLNVITILFANSGHLIFLLASLYLYYYLLLELFCPKLEIEDTIEIQERETGDIFTHTA
jgi:hypothetical protein